MHGYSISWPLSEPRVLHKNDVPRVTNPLTPIVLDGVNCQGTETHLQDCGSEVAVEYCAHYSISGHSDAGASCKNIRGNCIGFINTDVSRSCCAQTVLYRMQ